MRIDAIDVYYTKNHLKSPWRTAYGEDADIWSVITCLHSGKYSGWSESSPLFAPTYSPEYAFGVYHLVGTMFARRVAGGSFDSAEEINEALSVFKANPFAKSAIEMAWWTLEAARRELPLHTLLGGRDGEVEVGADFGITDDISELLGKIDGAFEAGFPRVKLKVKPGKDIDVLREVRRTFPKGTFHIDCNSGYTLEDLPLFREIDKLGLAMIEQPLFHADLHDHAKLQAMIDTPICLDESCNSLYAAERALELSACRYINVKPGRVGGLRNALKIVELCRQAGVSNWIGGMLETALGAGVCVELATLPNMTYPSDLFSSDTYYVRELTAERIDYSSPGKMRPSMRPGTPFIPDLEVLRERAVMNVHIEP